MTRASSRSTWWLPLPAVVLILTVTASAMITLILQSIGLAPLIGKPDLSFAAYHDTQDDLWIGAAVSGSIAAAATTVAMLIGMLTALVLGGRVGAVVRVVSAITIPVPHLVGATAVGLLLADSGLVPRVLGISAARWPDLVAGPWWVAVIVEYAWKESAFIAVVVAATLATRVARYEETAAVLGAGPARRLRHVTLPLAAPALVGAGTISFVYALGSYEVAWLLGRTYPEPLPVMAFRLFSSVDLAARPGAAAIAVTATLVTLVTGLIGLATLNRVRVDQ